MKNRINLSALTAHAATACGTPHTHTHTNTKNEGLVTSVCVFSSTASQKALCNISAYVNFFTTFYLEAGDDHDDDDDDDDSTASSTTQLDALRLPPPSCLTVPDRSHSASCHCQFWLPVFVTALLCLLCLLCSLCLSISV